jgi:non-ribosomal peptide synthetase component F/acyl carrier protein
MSLVSPGWLTRLGLAEAPDAVALVTPRGVVRRGRLHSDVLAVAEALHQLAPGQVAQLRFERGDPRGLVATLAVWERGGIPLFQAAGDSPIRADAVAASVSARLKIQGWKGVNDGPLLHPASLTFDWLEPTDAVDLGSDDPGYLIQTSGSSGTARVVFNTSWGLRNTIDALVERYSLADNSRALQFAPFGYDAWLADALPALQAGGALVYGPAGEWSGFRMIERVTAESSVTHAVLPPSVWRRLQPPACLRVAVSAGEALDAPTMRALRRSTPRLVNAYGPTEAAICSMTYEVADDEQRVPLGEPIRGVVISSVEGEEGQRLLRIGGVGVAHGYVGGSDHEHDGGGWSGWFGVEDGARFFQTADVVSEAGRSVYFVGRADRAIKRHGRLVNLERVEAAVRALPQVVDCVAAEINGAIVCDVVGVDRIADLRPALATVLEPWEIPTELRSVDELSRSASDKLERRTAARRSAADIEFDALRERVRAFWVAAVGVDDDDATFFALGGDSLGAMELLDQVAEDTGAEIDIGDFVEDPSFGALLRLVRQWHRLA